jgi:hypothetical protein
MGRPPIYGRAMTAAERQHRYWAKRITPSAGPEVSQGETILTLKNLHTDPVRVLRWYRLRFGLEALRAVRDAADQVLSNRAPPSDEIDPSEEVDLLDEDEAVDEEA